MDSTVLPVHVHRYMQANCSKVLLVYAWLVCVYITLIGPRGPLARPLSDLQKPAHNLRALEVQSSVIYRERERERKREKEIERERERERGGEALLIRWSLRISCSHVNTLIKSGRIYPFLELLSTYKRTPCRDHFTCFTSTCAQVILINPEIREPWRGDEEILFWLSAF